MLHSQSEVGIPLLWSAGPLSAAQRTNEMIAVQRTGKYNIADQRLRTTEMELPVFRCSAYFGLILKIFQREGNIK
jgi:hypothetical protein